MKLLDRQTLNQQINRLAAADTPFWFLIDFLGRQGLALPLDELAERGISAWVNGRPLGRPIETKSTPTTLSINPIPFETYRKGFDQVARHIAAGDSYLLNLTYPTDLGPKLDLTALYTQAQAPYKCLIPGHFLFYSPEPFLQINQNVVRSFPMKGTIAATEKNAAARLLNSQKELREHHTIVDLIRNDLSIISSDVRVESFRYLELIETARGPIIQTSSTIRGTLADDWPAHLGDLLLSVLPAGSVSGAPKARTVQIIQAVELSPRGFYTGVMGVYDGQTVDSCVIIRYIEQRPDGRAAYRSGGGITALSDARQEYDELLTKIYVPVV